MQRLLFLLVAALAVQTMLSSANAVGSQWVVFDTRNDSGIYGNPSYRGFLGVPDLPLHMRMRKIVFGEAHAIGIMEDGSLMGWGTNPRALSMSTGTMIPVVLPGVSGNPVQSWTDIAASADGTIAIASDGQIYMTGRIGPATYSTWTRMAPNEDDFFLSVSCGEDHCVAVSRKAVWGMGDNQFNQALPIPSLGPLLAVSGLEPASSDFQKLNILSFFNHTPAAPGTSSPMPASPGFVPPPSASLGNLNLKVCAGRYHTAIALQGQTMIFGRCSAVFGCPPATSSVYGLWVSPVPDQILQLQCGTSHTVVSTKSAVYGIGDNIAEQIATHTGPLPSVFIDSWTTMTPPGGFAVGLPVIVAGNLTLGRSSLGLPSYLPENALDDFKGLQRPSSGNTGDLGSFLASAFKRPSWLKLRRVDLAFGSSIRGTLAVRFIEDKTCAGNRPIGNMVVCAPSLTKPLASGWVSQRSLSLVVSQGSKPVTVTLPRGSSLSVFGQFWIGSSVTLHVPLSSGLPTDYAVAVSSCAQIQGKLSLGVDPDSYKTIKKRKNRSASIPLIQSGCKMFKRHSVAGGEYYERRIWEQDVEYGEGEAYEVSLDESGNVVSTAILRYRDVVYENGELVSTGYIGTRDAPTTDGAEYTDPSVPDASVSPTVPTTAEQSSGSIELVKIPSSSGKKLSSCQKQSMTTQQQTNSFGSQLSAVVTADSKSCDTWWIILASVLGAVVLIVIVILIVIFAVPSIRNKILPYRGARS